MISNIQYQWIAKECEKFLMLYFCVLAYYFTEAATGSFLYNFQNLIEITLRHGCSSVHLLYIFRPSFPTATSSQVLLYSANACFKTFFVKANFLTFLVVLILASPICDAPTLDLAWFSLRFLQLFYQINHYVSIALISVFKNL